MCYTVGPWYLLGQTPNLFPHPAIPFSNHKFAKTMTFKEETKSQRSREANYGLHTKPIKWKPQINVLHDMM